MDLVAMAEEARPPAWLNVVALLVWVLAGVVVFLPFAVNTSPLDAVTFRVPGHQGNWWHALVGAPFFLAFPMIWLRLRAFFSAQLSTPLGRRTIWVVVGLSVCGTLLVETPFLLHLAGTSEWQRLAVICLGLGVVIASGVLLYLRGRDIPPTRACLAGLNAAYLANAALCLVVYSAAPGPVGTRTGWFVTMATVWVMALELVWIFSRTSKGREPVAAG